jgi:very-short-patch-repair endonuclease
VAQVSFGCGHGAVAGEPGVVAIRRLCPVCMLVHETQRSRAELLRRVSPAQRAALGAETRIGAEYEWRCARGHDRYRATIVEQLTGTACTRCRQSAAAPAARAEAGLPFINGSLRVGTSITEHRLKTMLAERIQLNHRVNAIHIARTFHGRREVWPDIIVPQLRLTVEYDDPGRSRRAHRGLKAGTDSDKDEALREVGWDVIRVRAGGLGPLGPNSIVCTSLTESVADEVVSAMRRLRGDAAVDALTVRADRPRPD